MAPKDHLVPTVLLIAGLATFFLVGDSAGMGEWGVIVGLAACGGGTLVMLIALRLTARLLRSGFGAFWPGVYKLMGISASTCAMLTVFVVSTDLLLYGLLAQAGTIFGLFIWLMDMDPRDSFISTGMVVIVFLACVLGIAIVWGSIT